jgi:hypothetical protein
MPRSHWWFMHNAPKGIEVETKPFDSDKITIAHYARDLSGEEQPPFEGWFVAVICDGKVSFYREIDRPELWRPIQLP